MSSAKDLAVDTLAADLRVSLMKSARRLRAGNYDVEVSDAQYSVLAVLDRQGPCTARKLALIEGVQPPSISKTLSGLAERGLIQRTVDPADGRQSIVQLTSPGRELVRETRRRRNAWLAGRLSELSADERAVLASAAEILRRIAAS